MKKRIISFAIIITMLIGVFAAPCAGASEVRAASYSNAGALAPVVYRTGRYRTLDRLKIYASSDGNNDSGTSIPENVPVNVTAVSGAYGRTTYGGRTGWIDLSYAYNSSNAVNVGERLDMLRSKFPSGKYWNRTEDGVNNPDGYTDQPCEDGHSDKRCNQFDGTGQCHGFAIKLGCDLFGIHASCWERHYDLSKVRAGDLIRYRGRHTVMITGVYSTYFTVADCNWMYHCNIEWDRKMQKSYISFDRSNKNDGIYHCPANGGYIFGNCVNSSAAVTTAATTTTTKAKTVATTTTTKPKTAATTTTTKAKGTTTTTAAPTGCLAATVTMVGTNKYVLTTTLSEQGSSTAVLARTKNEIYTAKGVTKNGKTSFTFNAPAGKYKELVIIVDGCEEYCLDDFVLGKSSLPVKVTVKKVANSPESALSGVKITKQPANVSVKCGEKATFTVKASGTGLKYQWYYRKAGASDWNLWKGRVASSFTVASNNTWNKMQVRCRITDAKGKAVTSTAATVTLMTKITAQPADVRVKPGEKATFTVRAAGAGLKYQWYYKKSGAAKWSVWKGRVAPSFTVASNDSWNGMQVCCVITDANGSTVRSGTAKITLL